MFETLLKLLADNTDALAEVKKIQANYTTLSTEVGTLEAKLTDSISSRDKYKNFSKSAKTKLGFEDGEELNDETITAKIALLTQSKDKKINDMTDVSKLEISKLETALKDQKTSYEDQLTLKTKGNLDYQIELDLYKTTSGINAVNGKAQSIIIEELKSGATFEDGQIVYKSQDGTTVRKDGIPISLASKLEDIKTSEDFSFLFKAEVISGSGLDNLKNGNTGQSGPKVSDRAKAQMAQARKLGIKL